MNTIQKFIKDNSINLNGYGSDLNSELCAIVGYALYTNNGDPNGCDKLIEDIEQDELFDLTSDTVGELYRIYYYAYQHNYADWWYTEEAAQTWIFEKLEEVE